MNWRRLHLGVMWLAGTACTADLALDPDWFQAVLTAAVVLSTVGAFRDAQRAEKTREHFAAIRSEIIGRWMEEE